MPATIVTFTSGKGGVGKTTTVTNVSTALAMMGKRVIVMDADIGLRNLDIVMGLENRIVYDLLDVATGRCQLTQALVRSPRLETLLLLPAAQTSDKADITPDQMVAICNDLRPLADYVIIDSPAGIEHGFQNAVAPADRILVVTTSDVSALRDADKVIYLLERNWQQSPALVLNRYNVDLVRREQMRDIDDVLDILAIDLIGVVPEDQRITLSTDRGSPIVFKRRLQASRAYTNIARRITGDNVPLLNFRPRGFWSRLFG